jgi:hypothetical protein
LRASGDLGAGAVGGGTAVGLGGWACATTVTLVGAEAAAAGAAGFIWLRRASSIGAPGRAASCACCAAKGTGGGGGAVRATTSCRREGGLAFAVGAPP